MPVNLAAAVHPRFKSVFTLSMLVSTVLLAGCSTQSANTAANTAAGPGKAALAPLTADFGQPAPQANTAPVNMAKVRKYKLYIAPIIGAPLEVVTPLSLRFDTLIKTQSVTLSTTGESDADYMLKGYFSNISENNHTTVLYVWDVMDKQGNRVHRLQGQETVAGKTGWPAVTPPVMNKIADATLAEYFRWVSANAQ